MYHYENVQVVLGFRIWKIEKGPLYKLSHLTVQYYLILKHLPLIS